MQGDKHVTPAYKGLWLLDVIENRTLLEQSSCSLGQDTLNHGKLTVPAGLNDLFELGEVVVAVGVV